MNTHLIGYDIGGTKCAVILGALDDGEIQIIDRIQFATVAGRGPEPVLLDFEQTTRTICDKHGVNPEAIGISCGGPIDSRLGLVKSPPNLPGWDDIPIMARFEKTFGVPVKLENDANACALAEWKWGAGRGSHNMIFLTFGTGMGAGLILDGRLYTGTNDLAGEVGHVRLAEDGPEGYGKRGSFEGFCSGGGIARLAQEEVRRLLSQGKHVSFCRTEARLSTITAHTVAEMAAAGDPTAMEVFGTVAKYLGRGLAMLIDILNPEVIVIGSIFARQQDLLWPIAKDIIEQEALPLAASVCRVVPAALGESIGDYASLSIAATN